MSKIKKMTAVLLSVIMLVCMFTVPASAAGTKFTLIKTSLDSAVSGATAITDIGGSLYLVQGSTTGIYRIGDEEIKSWRSTGKLKPKKVNVDSDVPELDSYSFTGYFSDKGYASILSYDNSGNRKFAALKYNESANKITSVYSLDPSKGSLGITNDGYISVAERDDSNKYSLKIISPSGKTIKKISNILRSDYRELFTQYSDTAYYTMKGKNDKYTLYCVDKTGKTQKISKDYVELHLNYVTDPISYMPTYPAGYTYRTKESNSADPYYKGMYFSTFDGKFKLSMTTLFKLACDKENKYGFGEDTAFSFYFSDTIAELELCAKNSDGISIWRDYAPVTGEILVSIKDGKIKVLNSSYESYKTEDGDIFLVEDTNGKWGYIDKNGKTLTSMCDDATIFAKGAKYALVTVNGKTVLIDRKMNTVSNAAKLGDIQGLFTFSDSGELFTYTDKDGKAYLITYKG